MHYFSASPGGYVLGDGIPIQWRVLDYLIQPLFPVMIQALMSCNWIQPGDQTLEVGLGGLVPESLLVRPPWVGACLSIR